MQNQHNYTKELGTLTFSFYTPYFSTNTLKIYYSTSIDHLNTTAICYIHHSKSEKNDSIVITLNFEVEVGRPCHSSTCNFWIRVDIQSISGDISVPDEDSTDRLRFSND